MPRESEVGQLTVNPAFAAFLADRGLDTPAAILDLPGEVVSGHPDRHVVRIELPGWPTAFYLKRQHIVTLRERLRNWCAGFGWVSRSVREALVLQQLAASGLPAPRWVAAGEDDSGRAILMVEELAGATDLREMLRNGSLSARDRGRLAERLGQLIGRLHSRGFPTPDLTAKHLFVFQVDKTITPIDWQTTERRPVSINDRIQALAALSASVPDHLATPRERLRVLRAALHSTGLRRGEFADIARRIARETSRRAGRRSIRDQCQGIAAHQRLVWLAGEAVCAVPEVAAIWPLPAATSPFYGEEPGVLTIRLLDGRVGHLIRGRSFDPMGRFQAWFRGRPWRSPGVTLGRLLFHLERYGVPAPRLLAFGQRLIGPTTAEWFALSTPPAPPVTEHSTEIAEQLGLRLRQLHDAGCRLSGEPLAAFGLDRDVCIRDVTAIPLVKRVTLQNRATDIGRLVNCLDWGLHSAVESGYAAPAEREPRRINRLQSVGVSG